MTTSGLPESWVVSPLGHLGVWNGGGTPTKSNPAFWKGDIPWVSPKDIKVARLWDSSDHLSTGAIEASATTVIPKRSVLVVTRSGILAHTLPIAINEVPLAINQDLKAITPFPGIDAEYLAWALRGLERRILKECSKHGTTVHSVEVSRLQAFNVPVAPRQEQRRIVAKIEDLFSELYKGIDSLKTARRQLEVYRQAVLKHAFEGNLTAQWREENKDKLETPKELLARVKGERAAYSERQFQEWRSAVKKWEGGDRRTNRPKKPLSPKLLSKLDEHLYPGLPHLPESWVWEKLGWMTCGVEYGTSAKSSKSGRVPVLRMGNIQNGTFDWTDLVYTSDNDEIAGYLLHDGDVLFNRTNSPELVGKTAIYRGERPAIFAGYLIRVNQISTAVESEYVNFFLNSDVARQYGNSVKTDGVNQSNINGAKLVSYPFPYCSIQEQREIVRVLGEMMSIADDAEAKIHAEVERSVVLRQAILMKAFAGQLVPQDPNDEPAAVLLEKIRLDREKTGRGAPTARRKRKAKPVE